jgi:hypothetical protein
MSDSESKLSSTSEPKTINIYLIYVFICSSIILIYIFRRYVIFKPLDYMIDFVIFCLSFGTIVPGIIPWHIPISIFSMVLFILWFNKFISSKIKKFFGFEINNGVLSVTRIVDEPGVYNVFSDMVTSIGNGFIYFVTLKFMKYGKGKGKGKK